MPRRKTTDKNIRNIQRSSGSYHISVPIEMIRKLKWRERQKVVFKLYGKNKILIEDWPVHRGSGKDRKK